MSASVSAALPVSVRALLPAPLAEVMTDISKQPGVTGQTVDPQNRYAYCLNCGVLN